LPNHRVSPSEATRRRRLPSLLRGAGFASLLALFGLGGIGCVDHNTSSGLYVYDSGSGAVLEWDDINAVYTATGNTSTEPNRTITGAFNSSGTPLAWGGMALDESAGLMYLVYEDGTGYVIKKIAEQNGAISGTDNLISFTLNPDVAFSSGSFFSQVALDTSSHILYVMETAKDGSKCRVWWVNSSGITDGSSVTTGQTFTVTGDKYGLGLAAVQGGRFYGLFGYGSTITDTSGTTYDGERLRMGQSVSFNGGSNSQVLAGGSTQMNLVATSYGSLAYDAQNSLLYAFVKQPSYVTSPQVLVFSPSQFTSGTPNQAPRATLVDSNLANLRIIAHPAYSDWLVGADFTAPADTTSTGTGSSVLRIWKDPSGGGTSTGVTMTNATSIRGIALASTN
jgi:hypothetical protein